ncbi:hypothetical protein [Embleya sp. NPDC020886]|uniref:hypothetical protein n=1 Tax=Embleya sp. NPDC020886 TaxID=3363980 RepID=UPI0037AC9D6A
MTRLADVTALIFALTDDEARAREAITALFAYADTARPATGIDTRRAAEDRRAVAEANEATAAARRRTAALEHLTIALEEDARQTPRERAVRKLARMALEGAAGDVTAITLETIIRRFDVSSSTASGYRADAAELLAGGYRPGVDLDRLCVGCARDLDADVDTADSPAVTADRIPEHEALAAIAAGAADGVGVRELARRTGWSIAWVSGRMKALRERQTNADD